ncbi:MAG: hypothetical protein CVU46_07825 [Chloroflexi bacterium HGW-Chloroflexi-8]|nr:MAG: hypothetical protein CVU46_07825 [Chloroflexi bacterium HGW-Chloroflexi-8]
MKIYRNKFLSIVFLVLLNFQLIAICHPVDAAVTLVRFEIVYSTHSSITLEWETATEFDNLGFKVLRSLTEGGEFTQIGDFIAAEGSAVSGFIYQFTDNSATDEQTYFYKLEVIDLNSVSEFFGPITNRSPAQATQTNTTSMSTSTRTLTATHTQTGTAIITATITPTLTETSAFSFFTNTTTNTSTITPELTNTVDISGTVEKTPTILSTKIEVKTSTSNAPKITEIPSNSSETIENQSIRNLVLGFIAVLLVGGICILGLIYYSRHRQRRD